jgi:hypothetical protein
MAQGPHIRVPDMTTDELRTPFLDTPERRYFLIRWYPWKLVCGRVSRALLNA